jgi:hypothetical protein
MSAPYLPKICQKLNAHLFGLLLLHVWRRLHDDRLWYGSERVHIVQYLVDLGGNSPNSGKF